MKDLTVYPTGTCFEDVTMEFARRCHEDPKLLNDPGFLMVHGICLNEENRPYSHAWIEEADTVWFPGIIQNEKGFLQAALSEFYDHFQVQDKTKYSFVDLIDLGLRVGNATPPWEEKYRRLCKDYVDDSLPPI